MPGTGNSGGHFPFSLHACAGICGLRAPGGLVWGRNARASWPILSGLRGAAGSGLASSFCARRHSRIQRETRASTSVCSHSSRMSRSSFRKLAERFSWASSNASSDACDAVTRYSSGCWGARMPIPPFFSLFQDSGGRRGGRLTLAIFSAMVRG